MEMSGNPPASKKEAQGPPLANGMNAHSVSMCSHRLPREVVTL